MSAQFNSGFRSAGATVDNFDQKLTLFDLPESTSGARARCTGHRVNGHKTQVRSKCCTTNERVFSIGSYQF